MLYSNSQLSCCFCGLYLAVSGSQKNSYFRLCFIILTNAWAYLHSPKSSSVSYIGCIAYDLRNCNFDSCSRPSHRLGSQTPLCWWCHAEMTSIDYLNFFFLLWTFWPPFHVFCTCPISSDPRDTFLSLLHCAQNLSLSSKSALIVHTDDHDLQWPLTHPDVLRFYYLVLQTRKSSWRIHLS